MGMIELSQERWLGHFLEWARSRSDIRALALVGSGARSDHPADAWADLDLIVVATDPQFYLASIGWLEGLGEPWVSTVERNAAGDITERRVLFEGGLDVDFIVLRAENACRIIQDTPLVGIVRRGIRVLLDRDRIFSSLAVSPPVQRMPTGPEFLELVDDFWFHAAWTAKKLRRGELWVARSCCDVYMKRLLLRMMEWHARATKSQGVDTWYNGRFLEQWAPPGVVKQLGEVFAHYDPEDVWRALIGTMDLFRRIAQETAEHLMFLYPLAADQAVTAWIGRCHSER